MKSHFLNILNILNHVLDEEVSMAPSEQPQMPSMRINDAPPILKEIKDAITILPSHKAAGVDGLLAEFFKAQLGCCG